MNTNRRALPMVVATALAIFFSIHRPNIAFGLGPAHHSNRHTQTDETTRLPDDLIDFFSGYWSGSGEFASGKKIEADVIFAPELDRHWLLYRHVDRIPNKYKALGMWGFEAKANRIIMIVNDNFGGARRFSSPGWVNGKIVFEKIPDCLLPDNTAPSAEAYLRERFTFERQDANTFKMTYETAHEVKDWRLGDYLLFKRKRTGI